MTTIGILFFLLAGALLPAPASAAAVSDVQGDDALRPRIVSRSLQTRAVGAGGLARAISEIAAGGSPVWVGYAAPVIEGRRRMCCFDSIEQIDHDERCCHQCRLEERQSSGSFSTDDDKQARLEPSGSFVVAMRVIGGGRGPSGGVGRIGAYSEDCELNSGKLPFYWLTGVEPQDSLDYLARFVSSHGATRAGDDQDDEDDDGDGKLEEQALNVIAMHRGPAADRLLESFTVKGQPFSVREHASFWIGVSRGRPGYEILKRLVAGEPDDEMRKKVVFALSQNPTPESTDTLIAIAHSDRDAGVRGETIFWLAQKAGDRAARAITEAIENDPETEVKKKAVFALSQLPPDEGVPLLIDLAAKHRNPAVRKEAIFWLGQSGDPRALDFIEKILRS